MKIMSKMRKENLIKIASYLLTAVLLLCCCLFMYDFYKCLSGFIANKFREPQVMLPMISSYLLPVVCFLFYFYDCYVRKVGKAARWIYAGLVVVASIVNLTGIFGNFSVYASNNRLGVYETIPSIILAFPYDAIVFHILLLMAQAFSVVELIKPEGKVAAFKDEYLRKERVSLTVVEYLLLSVAAILAFVFFGSSLCAINAFENVLYDGKFLFLWLWLLLPLLTVIGLVWKVEKRNIAKGKKVVLLSVGAGLNVLFGLLFLLFELTSSGFIVQVGKPLFSIAFSISFPVEPLIMVAFTVLGAVLFASKLIAVLRQKSVGQETEKSGD